MNVARAAWQAARFFRSHRSLLAVTCLVWATLAAIGSAGAYPAGKQEASVAPVTASARLQPAAAGGATQAAGAATGAMDRLHPGINPANPNCNPGQRATYSGGTGLFYSNSFESTYVSAPFTGAADVTNADFTNVFLYPHSGTMTWDQYQASLPASQRGPTQEQIDAMTTALVCSSYFDALTQYNINPPAYSGDETTVPSCVDTALHDAKSTENVISYATLRSFVACEASNNGDASDQVNVFSATGIQVSNYAEDGTDMCSPGTDGNGSTGGYHGFGLSMPNFTIVPTNPACQDDAGIMESLSHEMVELMSDPAGLGWVHNPDPLNPLILEAEVYDQGEIADICSGLGAYPAPPVAFPATSTLTSLGLPQLFVSPYWSDQDGSCEPTAIMNYTLVPLAGSPSVRFTGSVHDLAIPVNGEGAPPGSLTALELDVVTGQDNLNSSSAANAIVQVDLNGQQFDLDDTDINEGAEWANNSLHAVSLPFPPGIPASDITQITLNTQFSGGLFGDNWDVAGVTVQAAIAGASQPSCQPSAVQLLNVTGTQRLSDGSTGLVRFTGGQMESFTEPLTAVPTSDANLPVTGLYLTVGTGADNLRGGNSAQDNANAVVNLTGGTWVAFDNINNNASWGNNETSPQVSLLSLNTLPPETTAADLASFGLQTDLPGGLFGDNWDVASLDLWAQLGCSAGGTGGTGTTVSTAPACAASSATLLDVTGTTKLSDGSTGLVRFTGGQRESLTEPLSVPSGDGPLPVTGLYLTVGTGGDDLRGGDTADAVLSLSNGTTVTFVNVNNKAEWNNYSTNQVDLLSIGSLPAGTTAGQLVSIGLQTDLPGGLFGDNWDVASLELWAQLGCPAGGTGGTTTTAGAQPACSPTSTTLLDVRGTFTLSDGSTGLVRLKGGSSQLFTEPLSIPPAEAGLPVTGLYLTVGTGGDDLRSGDTANAVLNLSSGVKVIFVNINNYAEWSNNTTSPQTDLLDLTPLPLGTTLGDLSSFGLQTDLPGGLFGDNWDVSSLYLSAELGCPSSSPPAVSTVQLLDEVGDQTLSDGSTGLCRLTGQVHDCGPWAIALPEGFSASDAVGSLQMTIVTGNDDLRGGTFAGDNANVKVSGLPQFTDVNEMHEWPNGYVATFPLAPWPSGPVSLGSISSLDVNTMFSGSLGGIDTDNWDIDEIVLTATVTPAASNAGRQPAEATGPARAFRGSLLPPTSSSPLLAVPPVPGTDATPFMAQSMYLSPSVRARHDLGASGGAQVGLRPSLLVEPAWSFVANPSIGLGDSTLKGISCSSTRDCVAVGYTASNDGVPEALSETWDGKWVLARSKPVGQYSMLNGVSCASPNDCVAVGFSGSGGLDGRGGPAQALIETWHGRSWSVGSAHVPSRDSVSVLDSVSCTPAGVCQAVGYQEAAGGGAQTLIERWSGGSWRVVDNPSPGGNSVLYGVSCANQASCVAVGYTDVSRLPRALVERWDGREWTIWPSLDENGGQNVLDGAGGNILYSVSCPEAFQCVAVGSYADASRVPHPLIERVGTAEPLLALNRGTAISGTLYGISCTSARSCAAVGTQLDPAGTATQFNPLGAPAETLVEGWDGASWSVLPSANPGRASNFLTADWCQASCMAVGGYARLPGYRLALALSYRVGPPAPPTLVEVLAGKGRAEVFFRVPALDNGSPVVGYTVVASDSSRPASRALTVAGRSSPIIVVPLRARDRYTFTVTADNFFGTSPPSAPSRAVFIR